MAYLEGMVVKEMTMDFGTWGERPVLVAKPSLMPELEGFAVLVKDVENEAGGLLLVSADVPEEFRPLALLQEIIEAWLPEGPTSGVSAAKYVLERVCEELMDSFLGYRIGYLERLVEFYKIRGESALAKRANLSLVYLKSLAESRTAATTG